MSSKSLKDNLGTTRQIADEALYRGVMATGNEFAAGIIFRPGGVKAGNVFTTWAEIMEVVTAVNGATTVFIDASLAAAIVPPGTYNGFGCVELSAFNDGIGYILQLQDGATLANWSFISGVVVECACVTKAAFTYEPNTQLFMENFAGIAFAPGALVPAIQAPSSFGFISRTAVFDNSNAPTVAVLNCPAGSFVTMYIQDAAFNFSFLVTGNEIGGQVGAQLFWENDASTPPLASSLYLGTLNQEPTAQAAYVEYSPAVPANWVSPPPTTVAQALDRIAANTTNAHPIP
jgi:hypothetical protein